MLSLNYENINDVMTQIFKLCCASFRYVNIVYVLAYVGQEFLLLKLTECLMDTHATLLWNFTLDAEKSHLRIAPSNSKVV